MIDPNKHPLAVAERLLQKYQLDAQQTANTLLSDYTHQLALIEASPRTNATKRMMRDDLHRVYKPVLGAVQFIATADGESLIRLAELLQQEPANA